MTESIQPASTLTRRLSWLAILVAWCVTGLAGSGCQHHGGVAASRWTLVAISGGITGSAPLTSADHDRMDMAETSVRFYHGGGLVRTETLSYAEETSIFDHQPTQVLVIGGASYVRTFSNGSMFLARNTADGLVFEYIAAVAD